MATEPESTLQPADDSGLVALLDYLKRSRGFDLHAYKETGLVRRLRKRLQAIGIEGYPEYLDYLEVHPDEFEELFNTILINVTGFFRDPTAWEFIAHQTLPRIASQDRDVFRVWSCGCAGGHEAYTIAMLLAEQFGRQEFRRRVKVYATDVDGDALEQARQATYSAVELEDVPEPLRVKYFEPTVRGYVFDKELRRSIIFGRNDVLQDAPISRLDLLICRNMLMYLNAEAQARVLSRFHFALNDQGFLFLGKAELLLTHAHLFAPVEMKHRIFSKILSPARRERVTVDSPEEGDDGDAERLRLSQAAFGASPVGEVVIDAAGTVVQINDRARVLLETQKRDLGLSLLSLECARRMPGLRGAIEQAQVERRGVHLRGIDWISGSENVQLDIHIVPLVEGGVVSGLALFVIDATRVRRLREELTSAQEQLEAISEELESTNEELETTNEELQSANEELETTNEELQSTNEELEAMNEELQSTNEELHTVNGEVRQRSEEVQVANTFLESVLTGIRSGVIVIDQEMCVTVWNRRSEETWGLRSEEVQGKHFLSLDIGLPVDALKRPIKACLSGESESLDLKLTATNRRGRTIECEVVLTPLGSVSTGVRGVILLTQER